MRYAVNANNNKVEVTKSKEKANCPDCGQEVHGRKGRIRSPYWKHPNNSDCDNWHEPITEWHINWQDRFPKNYQEISLTSETGEIHRADIQLPSGFVVEIQNSPINIDEIEQRESFYGKKGLLWIINGTNLCRYSSIKYESERRVFAISIEMPNILDFFKEYNMDSVNIELYESRMIKNLYSNPSLKKLDNQNGNYYWFEFHEMVDFDKLIDNLEEELYRIIVSLYGVDNYYQIHENIHIEKHIIKDDRFVNVVFTKKYWRKFIDKMKYPVIIDNLSGLYHDHIFDYQKNQILTKSKFITSIAKKNWL